ncbi:MAG: T9SS type B sorting domain-containing protein [Saprospiraceae bacterium]|nr:T9SS type B sorting domain-containing protein [Saprospiraceae bacterium]
MKDMKIPLTYNFQYWVKTVGVLCLLLMGDVAYSTHIIGGDITYRHLRDDVFEITLTFRRDCINGADDAQFDDPASLAIYTGEGVLASWLGDFGFLDIPFNSDDTLNTTIISDCGFIGQQVCVQETKYVTEVRLPYRKTGYHITYQRCCRNITLNNVVDPLNTGSTYTIFVSGDALKKQNSSPVFDRWADIYICANEQLNFNHSASDSDGDSLVYKLITPYMGATEMFPRPDTAPPPPYDTVVWLPPYNTFDPMGGTPLSFDPETGFLTAIPNAVGQFLIGVSVEEYRHGIHLSTVRRDFQYNVRICEDGPAVAFTVENPICNDFTATFENTSTSVDQFTWFFDYPSEDPEFVSTEESPTFTFPGPGTYTVLLEGVRSADGCSGIFSQEVVVLPNILEVDFTASIAECGNESFVINLEDNSSDITDPNNQIISWEWTIITDDGTFTGSGQNTSIEFSGSPGTITLDITAANGCINSLTEDFEVAEFIPEPDFGFSIGSCNEDGSFTLSLNDQSTNQSDIISFDWIITIGGNIMQLSGPSVDVIVNADDIVQATYIVTYTNGCTAEISKEILISEIIPLIDFEVSVSNCNDDGSFNVTLLSTATPSDQITESNWEVVINSESLTFTGAEVLLENLQESDVLSITHTTTYSNDCVLSLSKEITVLSLLPQADFVATATSCNVDGTVEITLDNTSSDLTNISSTQWTVTIDGDVQSYTGNQVNLSGIDPDAVISVLLEVEYNNNCSASVSRTINVADILPQAIINAEISACNDNGTVNITFSNGYTGNENPATIAWSVTIGSQVFTSENSTFTLENISTGQSISAAFDITFENGCTASDMQDINIDDLLPTAGFSAEVSQCNDDGSYELTITDTSGSTDMVSWTISINGMAQDYTGSPVVITVNQDDIVIVVQNVDFDNGCSDVNEQTINVSDLIPAADFTAEVSQCNNDGTIDVTIKSASVDMDNITSYNWTVDINGSQSNPQGSEISLTGLNLNDQVTITLDIEYANGCTASVQKAIDLNDIVPQADFTATVSSCNADGTVELTLDNTSSDIENVTGAQWTITIDGVVQNFSGNQVNLSGIAPDAVIDVTLDVQFNNNCSSSVSKSINVADIIPQAIINAEVSACNDDGTVNITFSNGYSGDVNPTTTSWSVTIGSQVFTSENPSFTLENINTGQSITAALDVTFENGCTASDMQDINIDDLLPTAGFSAEVSQCNDDGSYELTITDTSGSTDMVSWNISINGNAQDYTGSPVVITVNQEDVVNVIQNVQFDNGCSDDNEQTINVSDLIPAADLSAEVAQCNDDGTVDVTLSASTSVSGVNSYNWIIDVNGNTSMFNTQEVVLSGVPSDAVISVDLDVVFDNGCNAQIQRDINVSQLIPQASYSVALVSCPDNDRIVVELTESSGLPTTSISWNIESEGNVFTGNESSIIIEIDRNATTTVNLDVDFANGCSDQLSETLDLSDILPTPQFDVSVVSCPSLDSVTVLISDITETDFNKGSYSWMIGYGGDVFIFNTAEFEITLPRDSTINVELNIGLDNGCTLILDSGSFVPGPLPTVEFVSDIIKACVNDTVTLVANPDPSLTYTWDPEDGLLFEDTEDKSNPRTVVDVNKTYFVTVSDGVCQDTGSVMIMIDESSFISITGDTATCDGNIVLTAQGNKGGGIFQWSEDESFTEILFEGDTLRSSIVEDQKTFWLRLVNSSCDSQPVSFTVINGMPEFGYFNPYEICRGDTATFPVVNLRDYQIFTYQFEDDPHIVSGGDTNIPMIGIGTEEMDSFYLMFTAINQFGCSFSDSVLVRIVDNPEISFDANLTECGAYEVCFNITSEYNGFPLWDFGHPEGGRQNNSFDENPCYTYPGPGDYLVTLTTISNFCSAKPDSLLITLTEDFTVDPIEDIEVCLGDTVRLSAGASVEGLNYVWCTSDGDTLSIGQDLEYIADTGSVEVILKGFDFFNCSDSTRFTIDVFDFDLEVDVPDLLCSGQETQLFITNVNGSDLQYLWGPDDIIIAGEDTDTPTAIINGDATITLSIFEPNRGCMLDTAFNVSVTTIDAIITADPGTTINEGEEVVLDVDSEADIVDYEWSDPTIQGNPVTVAPTTTTTYTVTVTDVNGCTATASITIEVRNALCNEEDVFIPNAFTPNGDNNNDVFLVRSNFIEEMELIIYNRWGQEVFRSTDQDVGWDGTLNGEPLSPDVYGFRLEVLCINEVVYVTKGNVSLLR